MTIKDESAVSPVIGVMLMLVVTIIIAAVVSAFAGGLTEGTEKAPQASIDCVADLSDFKFTFEHKGGDAFALNGVKIVFASQDTKTTLTTADIGGNAVAFEELGAEEGDAVIGPGDKFVLQGSDPGWTKGITFGGITLMKNSIVEWTVLDKATDKAIAAGSIALI